MKIIERNLATVDKPVLDALASAYEITLREAVATILAGVPVEGGSLKRSTLERIVTLSFLGGLAAHMREPLPALKETAPLVVFFGTEGDREEFRKALEAAMPNATAYSL